jgi:hypothetical protein
MISQYNLLPITIFLLILYFLSYFLYKDGTIKHRTYKLIWIILLIVTSLIVGIIGILMEIFINLQLLPIDTTLIFWHVEAGILATVTGFFHIHIYWKKFQNIFL